MNWARVGGVCLCMTAAGKDPAALIQVQAQFLSLFEPQE